MSYSYKNNRALVYFISILCLGLYTFSSTPQLAFSHDNSFADLIEKVAPSVVSITVEKEMKLSAQFDLDRIPAPFRDFFPQIPNQKSPRPYAKSVGSGFFISEDGYIVTNNHVIEGSDKIIITTKNEKEYEAKLIGSDPLTDLALLKIKNSKEKFHYAIFEKSPNLRVGDWVVAVGSPYSLAGTATAGIISATKRNTGTGTDYYDFIQIDAPINRGNSGGPTFNLQGKVIGVNSQIYSPSGGNIGIGFAIPSDVASKIINKLKKKGHVIRGWLGVLIGSIDTDIADSIGLDSNQGAIVQNVSESSPAEKHGFQAGDVILSINNQKIKDPTFATRLIGDMSAGEKAVFKINRLGKEKTIKVTIGKRPDENILNGSFNPSSKNTPDSNIEKELLGIKIRNLKKEEMNAYKKAEIKHGVIITYVDPKSSAYKKRVVAGMIITQINQKQIYNSSDFINEINASKQKKKKAVLVFTKNPRSGQSRSFGLSLNEKN